MNSVDWIARGVVALGALGMMTACGSSSSSKASALEGDWDITQAVTPLGGPSSMTVHGDTLTAVLDYGGGSEDPYHPGCTFTKNRDEVLVGVSSGASGTVTRTTAWSGASCPTTQTSTLTIVASQTRVAASSATDLNGDWNATWTVPGDRTKQGLVTVDGLLAKTWGEPTWAAAANEAPSLQISVAGGVLVVTGGYPFTARKR